mgnify:FL=1
MHSEPPYVAVITPPGEGGIGIIALWGPGAVRVLAENFAGSSRDAAQLDPGAMGHGSIRRDGQTLDEVILARLGPPHEKVEAPYFEVNCHGGAMAVRAVLGRLEEAGARVVDPTEVQKPATGPPLSRDRISAAAGRELLHAPTRLSLIMLLHQKDGALSRALDDISKLLDSGEKAEALDRLDALLAIAPLGRALVDPPQVALLGPPNAGKSTLFNALLEQERVIVHHEPGTTRDVVRETVSIRGVPFELMDAAGIAPPRDGVEEHAVNRARRLAGRCDVALIVFDARAGHIPDGLPSINPEARRLAAANKMDLVSPDEAERLSPPEADEFVHVSALHGRNLEQLEEALLAPYAEFTQQCREGAPVPFDKEAVRALETVREELANGSAPVAVALLRELRG